MSTDKEKKSQKVIRSRPSKPASSGKRARRKGHNYERTIVKLFRDLGYDEAKTSRLGSRLLDSAKVDICDIPFNVQCKAVEANINYVNLSAEIAAEIEKLVPKRKDLPILIFHKKDRQTTVAMTLEEFTKLVKILRTKHNDYTI
jgi:hypothetical protein